MKKELKSSLSPEIKEIILFLTSARVKPLQSLALSLLREKIRTYQSELNLKLLKIYELRNQFSIIAEMNESDEKRDKIREINDKLKYLTPLKPENIMNKGDK
jgi:hypothetical protein